MEQKEIKYQGKRLSYRSRGEGLPVVLVHGFGEDSRVWDAQLNALKDYHLIVPDLPGTNRSEMIDDMSMEGMAAALEKLIVHETATVYYKEGEPGSVIMIGHSMGGYITLAFAEKHPQMLRGFGLFHSSAYADTEEKKQNRRKSIDFIQRNGAYEFLKTAVPNLYATENRESLAEEIKAHLETTHNFSPEMLVSYYQAMIDRPDRRQVLQEAHVPVLFILGKHDTAVSFDDGLEQSHLPRSSYVHILENSGHMGMREQTGEANEHLQKYLDFVKTAR